MSYMDPELCVRWGDGEDRCVRPFDHDGDCMDTAGNTTTSLARKILSALHPEGRNSGTREEILG
jgi:hypothetical protein